MADKGMFDGLRELLEEIVSKVKDHHERLEELRHIKHDLHKVMSALENFTAALNRITASVDAAVTVMNTPHPTDAQVQAGADALNAQSDRLDAASGNTPPVVAPPATP